MRPIRTYVCLLCGDNLKVAGRGRWSPYFCETCDDNRMARLSEQFKALSAMFKPAGSEGLTK